MKSYNHMIGRLYMHNMREVLIEGVRPTEDGLYVQFLIKNKWVTVNPKDVAREFLPIEGPVEHERSLATLKELMASNRQLTDLSSVLLNNIRKMEASPNYIGQAKEINEHAKTLIDMERLRLEMIKIVRER